MRMRDEQASIWDEKSSSYPRCKAILQNSFESQIINKFIELGINFNSHIVDVGCGTGIFSLYIAKLAKSVLCVDISLKMLEILKNDANNLGVNIDIFCGNFWQIDKKFDLAFLSRSPAVYDEESASMFLELADKIAYINHIKPMYNSIITPVLNGFECQKNIFIFSEFLKQNNIHYKRKKIVEKNVVTQNVFEIFDSLLWHLKINKIQFNLNKVLEFLEDDLKDDFIYFFENPVMRDTLKHKTKTFIKESTYEMVVVG